MTFDPLGLVGRVVDGKYVVEAVAGSGGTATVYRALHKTWGRRVALKVVRSAFEMSEAHRVLLMNQLVTEGALLASLSERTPAIVQARDFGSLTTADGTWAPYLVLEWLEGQTLDAMLEDERARGAPPRGIAAAIELLEPVARALGLAHRSGVAHRDVKPGNLFVVQGGPDDGPTVKVVDFGIAKVVADVHAHGGGFRRTARNVTAFTPAYGAPEQFSRAYGSTGPWTDVFCLGLVLYETAVGAIALGDGELADLAARACSQARRPSLREVMPEISLEVEAVFARAMAVKADDRYARLDEFWDDLRRATGLGTGEQSLSRISVRTVAPAAAPIEALPPARPAQPMAATEPAPLVAAGNESASLRAVTTTSRRRKEEGTRRSLLLAASLVSAISAIIALTVPRRDGPNASAPPVAPLSPTATVSTPKVAPAPSCAEGMVLVPGGKFFMGSDAREALDFERPAHKVTLNAFCIDRTEVTVAAYRQCSDRGDCRRAPTKNDWPDITAAEHAIYDPLCNAVDPEGRANHPINCVDWSTADAYCRARGARLPTEAEWELAARGQDGRTYPWGDAPPSPTLLNACGSECLKWSGKRRVGLEAMYAGDDGFATTAPVGSFPKGASPYGALDIVGNVWEWVADVYGPYGSAETIDPRGPARGDERVIRGGAWNGAYPDWVRPTFRYKDVPSKRSHGIGFRCAAPTR